MPYLQQSIYLSQLFTISCKGLTKLDHLKIKVKDLIDKITIVYAYIR